MNINFFGWFSGISIFIAGVLPNPSKTLLIILSLLSAAIFIYEATKENTD
jgi:hypothetical protein